jgi:2'-5' RNA ligase
MKNYTSYFLAILLPTQFQQKFIDLLGKIKSIQPSLQLVNQETPHITLYYLNKNSEGNFHQIEKVIKDKGSLLENEQLTIGGLGCFGKDNPKVIFLDVKYTPNVKVFNQEMDKVLSDYSAKDNLLTFKPHFTLALIKTSRAKKDFLEKNRLIERVLEQISWPINIEELVLYGVNSKQQPEYQEKLIEFKLLKYSKI